MKKSDLEFGDHGHFGVVAGRERVDQSLGEHLAVELLEHVLVLDVLEYHHLQKIPTFSNLIKFGTLSPLKVGNKKQNAPNV